MSLLIRLNHMTSHMLRRKKVGGNEILRLCKSLKRELTVISVPEQILWTAGWVGVCFLLGSFPQVLGQVPWIGNNNAFCRFKSSWLPHLRLQTGSQEQTAEHIIDINALI